MKSKRVSLTIQSIF